MSHPSAAGAALALALILPACAADSGLAGPAGLAGAPKATALGTDPCAADSVTDTDGDGVADCLDPCPADSPDDADGDGACDSAPAVALDTMPRDFAVHQRDGEDTCRIVVDGATSAATRVRVVAWDGATWAGTTVGLVAGDGSFSLSAPLPAGLTDYDLHVGAWDGSTWQAVAYREDVACGDLFLVQGQSNAVAADYHGEGYANDDQSPWIRSFGTSTTTPSRVLNDLDWEVADGELYQGDASIGGWALRLARNLVDTYGVPIGIINGAVGGTLISQHLRNDAAPEDLSTIYGRFLYRASRSTFQDEARALIWYQGESDGALGNLYQGSFTTLRDAWLEDFPALEQIYLVQVRLGCGIPPLLSLGGTPDVREIQRRLPTVFPDVRLMSATALPGHDGCHYTTDGYLALGDHLTAQVVEDYYGEPHGTDVDPPTVASITWDDALTLRLHFAEPDQTLTMGGRFYQHFLIRGASVTAATVDGGDVVLTLDRATLATRLTWNGYLGTGGDLVNANGVGMLAFFDFPITR